MESLRVIYHHENGAWWAESPDVERWYAAGSTYSEVRQLAVEGIPFALGRNGRDVEIEHFVPAGERVAA